MQQVEQLPVRLGVRATRGSPRSGPALREARRRANHRQGVPPGDLRCECDVFGCRAPIPALAEGYRGVATRFIVVPGHAGYDTVVAAADRFFVVEPKRVSRAS